MTSRFKKDGAESGPQPGGETRSGVVNLADARRTVASRATASTADLYRELEETRELLDRGLPSAAEQRLNQFINSVRRDPALLAHARRALSVTLEILGRYNESLEAVRMYESVESRGALDAETFSALRVQIGIAYNYAGDHPKAVGLLSAELREATENHGTDAQLGAIYAALARVYRTINEHSIARDHVNKALEHYRRTGEWRGLAEAYFGLAMANVQEGLYEPAIENFEQAANLVGAHPAPYFLGKIYNNLAGAYWFLKRPHDGIRALEKAVSYCESTEHKDVAATGYNNLGINLMLTGEWPRAHTALKRALEISLEIDNHGKHSAVIFDSLGELCLLRGDFEEALSYLERAVRIAKEIDKKWYVAQALRTLTRCYLALGLTKKALLTGAEALSLAERIGDRQAVCESSLLLSEAHLQNGAAKECAALLQTVSEETADSATDIAVAGEAQRVFGMLALTQHDATLAAHYFGRCLSIFDMLGDRYRGARAHYWLGRADAAAERHERAAEHYGIAVNAFRELGAKHDLARAEKAQAALANSVAEENTEPPATTQLLTLRLAEAVASRELLLRELAAVVQQETGARRVLIAEPGEEGRLRVVIAHGYTNEEGAGVARALEEIKTDEDRATLADSLDARVYVLRAPNAPHAVLVITPRSQSALADGSSFEPLLRVVELGMDVCALRSRARAGRHTQAPDSLAGASLMPGFIHSSPAMTQLVEEVHKIRSSDVTVLVTGESGTGKELVARAIHAISSRRSKVFAPFNCTAVPKELSEGYLFGYRRVAFTGAVNDSAGVIRTAAGGTLFLDEIGDLPIDVQPKLLRFLQEGEIQPLGEQRPVKVDVRIIAATNSDLETMVSDGRFREDLYYRLNVIRLRVPPLRERRSEVPTIVNYYINHYSTRFNRRDITITPQTLDLLMVCDWPGNVRQLTNEIQRIVARAEDGTVITPDHLSPELHRIAPTSAQATVTHINGATATAASDAIAQGLTLADATAELERRMIAEALRKHNGNISRAARELGLTRRGLYLKLGRHDLSASA
jgi:DNA-binding NtrC family response regulator/tetratricopeptide (TPR) repeat protein